MDTAALMISAVALLGVVWASISAHRSANSSRSAAASAKATELVSRTPRLVTTSGWEPGGMQVAVLRNDGPVDLDDLAVTLLPAPPSDPQIVIGISDGLGNGPRKELELGALPVGESRTITLWRVSPSGNPEFRLRCVVRAGVDTWRIVVAAKFPRDDGPSPYT